MPTETFFNSCMTNVTLGQTVIACGFPVRNICRKHAQMCAEHQNSTAGIPAAAQNRSENRPSFIVRY